MPSLRRFKMTDLFRLSRVNLDYLTENYNIPYYQQYLAAWPNCFYIVEQTALAYPMHQQRASASPVLSSSVPRPPSSSSSSTVCGYLMGKVEGLKENWHGHVSALSVSPDFRRLGLAETLMNSLERISDSAYNAYFVDLYVRKSNSLAISMYKKFGYIVYREVINYYSGEENAYDMRKALKRDVDKKSMIALPHPVHPDPNWD